MQENRRALPLEGAARLRRHGRGLARRGHAAPPPRPLKMLSRKDADDEWRRRASCARRASRRRSAIRTSPWCTTRRKRARRPVGRLRRDGVRAGADAGRTPRGRGASTWPPSCQSPGRWLRRSAMPRAWRGAPRRQARQRHADRARPRQGASTSGLRVRPPAHGDLATWSLKPRFLRGHHRPERWPTCHGTGTRSPGGRPQRHLLARHPDLRAAGGPSPFGAGNAIELVEAILTQDPAPVSRGAVGRRLFQW